MNDSSRAVQPYQIAPPARERDGSTIDLASILSALAEHRWMILGVACITTLLAVAYLFIARTY
jgi:uncharacterized protein involved in exopolysaccharide biosynthesis